MKKLKIYLDTSVINFLYANDVPELKKITVEFFDCFVMKNKYKVYVSNVVIQEINKTKERLKRNKLLKVISKYNINIFTFTKESEKLADIYFKNKIVPISQIEDAYHIAISTCNSIDILLSWNFKHLPNIKKQLAVKKVNEKEGYYSPLMMTNPMEVIYEI
ncbi:PIN domain nuclease [bacterium]|nr:PIN domain nuclease [bacterium]